MKKINQKAGLFFCFCLWSISLLAAPENNSSTLNLKQSLPTDCFFSGDFEQSRKISALPQPLQSSGKLFFSCDHGLIWHNQRPFPESLIYTDKNIHFRHLPDEEPIPLDGQQHYYLAQFLISLLSADVDKIEKDFSVHYQQNGNSTIVELLPTSQFIQKGLESIAINKKVENKKESLSITIKNKKDQQTHLTITNLSPYKIKEKNELSRDCYQVLKNHKSCEILVTPHHFQHHDIN